MIMYCKKVWMAAAIETLGKDTIYTPFIQDYRRDWKWWYYGIYEIQAFSGINDDCVADMLDYLFLDTSVRDKFRI